MRNTIKISAILITIIFQIPVFSQVNTPFGDLLFADTLELDPLHSWITIDEPESSVWELGQPLKAFFDQPHSGAKALMTDTSANYGTDLNDAFTIAITWGEYFFAEGILSFYHKYDTDHKTDGGIIEISYDLGVSWTNMQDVGVSYDRNFIGLPDDTIKGGEYAFSGKSDGWKYVELQWIWMVLVKKNLSDIGEKVLVRFRFVSDEVDTQKEGWMIDDIVFRGYDASGDIEGHSFNRVIVYPNPAHDKITFSFAMKNEQKKGIYLYNSLGQIVQTAIIENSQLNISDLSHGLYFYKILNDKEILDSGKFIKH